MRLLSIRLKGFKSFAQESILHFDDDIIGIVGPNGSGKSNIIDAIRWVLGEQKTSELRLDTMTNVIFNGSKKRKPATTAEVHITFDNDKGIIPLEYKQVTISRIVDRSGHSEYRINEVQCRLKDILNLLSDTGIGSDTYAIIELGMVDEILSDRDAYRRKMIEQAAGIGKFKSRKKETFQKLVQTDNDLTRVEDILNEIYENLKTLEKQARRTSKYRELKQKLRELSLLWGSHQLKDLKNSLSEHRKSYSLLEDQMSLLDANRHQIEAELEHHKMIILNDEQILSENQQSLAKIIQNFRDLEYKKNLLNERKNNTLKNIDHLSKQLEELQLQSIQVNQSIQSIKEKSTIAFNDLSKITSEWAIASQSMEIKRKEELDKKQKFNDISSKIRQIENEIQILEQQLAGLTTRKDLLIRSTKETIENQAHRIKTIEVEKEKSSELYHQKLNLEKELNELIMQEESRHRQLADVQDRYQTLQKQWMSLKSQLSAKKNEHEITKSLVESLEGYPESIKFLSKQSILSSKVQLFSEIFSCDTEYKIALECFLEPFLNYFVAQDKNTAIEAIHLLQKSQKGKAHFFVLDKFGRNIEDTPFLDPSTYLPAIHTIQCETQFENLMSELLHKVYIFVGPSHLFAQSIQEDIVLLSPDGSIISGPKWTYGGSIGLFEGKKTGRKKNLELLDKEIKHIEKEAIQLEQTLESTQQEIKNLIAAEKSQIINHLRRKISEIQDKYAVTLAKIETEERNIASLLQKSTTDQNELKLTEDQIIQLENSRNHANQRLSDIKSEATVIDEDFKLFSENLQSISAHYHSLNIRKIQQESLCDLLKKELDFAEDNLNQTKLQIDTLLAQDRQLRDELVRLDHETTNVDQSISKTIELRKQSETDITEIEQKYYQKKNHILELENQLKLCFKNIQNLQSNLNELKDKINNTNFKIQGICDRLEIEFQIQKHELIETNLEIEDFLAEELPNQIDRLKQKLIAFNDINPMAVEAYEEIKKRYEHIRDQRDDILEAKENLLSTIQEIEATAREKYLWAFEQIRNHFVEVFRHLFTEDDQCDMILENPDNPLESGIQIIAKPKGKKPQTLAQLSGGEKTLTAIAFLFSIYLIKPAPFCIFDEVDAPLDDANIEKFTKIIKTFSKNSQFIIVTHNKGTMAEVNSIFGVYMEESGVSNLSRVSFSHLKHEGLFETSNT